MVTERCIAAVAIVDCRDLSKEKRIRNPYCCMKECFEPPQHRIEPNAIGYINGRIIANGHESVQAPSHNVAVHMLQAELHGLVLR